MGARPHHVMSDGGVLSDDEEWTSRGGGSGLARTHYYWEGAVVKVVDLSSKKMIRAIHVHDEWVEDYVVGAHFPTGKPEVPVRWEEVSDKPSLSENDEKVS